MSHQEVWRGQGITGLLTKPLSLGKSAATPGAGRRHRERLKHPAWDVSGTSQPCTHMQAFRKWTFLPKSELTTGKQSRLQFPALVFAASFAL